MSSKSKNLSTYDESSIPYSSKLKVGIVVADWNADITHALYDGCLDTLKKHGVQDDNIHTAQVPGAFELPSGAKMLASHTALDAVICLGCVIKGETDHDKYINSAVANGATSTGSSRRQIWEQRSGGSSYSTAHVSPQRRSERSEKVNRILVKSNIARKSIALL